MKSSIVRTVAEGTFFASSGSLLVKAIGLVTVFLILRSFGAAQYGVLELTLSIIALLSIFSLPGLDSVVLADAGAHKGKGELEHARQVLSAYFALQCGLAGVAFAVVFFGAGAFSAFYQVPLSYVLAVSFLFLLSPLQLLYTVVFRLHLRFFQQSYLTFLQEGAKLAVLAFCIYILGFGPISVLIALVISQAVGLTLLAPAFLRLWRLFPRSQDGTEVKWWSFLWGHSAWGILSSYVGNLGRAVRLWIIQFLLGPEAVGLYAVASGLMGHTTALAPLSTVLTPMLPHYAHDPGRFSRLMTKGVQYQLLANVAVGIGAFFLVPPVISFLFPQYVSALSLYQLMLLALIPGAVVSIVTPAFAALKLQRSLFFSMVLKTVLTAVFTYGGILLFGLWGLAYESILTASVQAVERLRSIRRKAPGFGFSRAAFSSFEDDRVIYESVRRKLLRGVPFIEGLFRK